MAWVSHAKGHTDEGTGWKSPLLQGSHSHQALFSLPSRARSEPRPQAPGPMTTQRGSTVASTTPVPSPCRPPHGKDLWVPAACTHSSLISSIFMGSSEESRRLPKPWSLGGRTAGLLALTAPVPSVPWCTAGPCPGPLARGAAPCHPQPSPKARPASSPALSPPLSVWRQRVQGKPYRGHWIEGAWALC